MCVCAQTQSNTIIDIEPCKPQKVLAQRLQRAHRLQPTAFMHCPPAPEICADLRTGNPTFLVNGLPRHGTSPAITIRDIDMLFQAVTERLRQAARSDAASLPSLVLECTDALDQLHEALIEQCEAIRLTFTMNETGGAISC